MTDPARITAIVDFADDADSAPTRRVFGAAACTLSATSLTEVVAAIDAAERLARAGRWVVGFVSHDASPAFDEAMAARHDGPLPLAWFAAFDAPVLECAAPLDVASVAGHLDGSFDPEALSSDVSDADYVARVARIRELIAAGDVYQVNLTVPFRASIAGSALSLYEQMRLAQGGRYAAYLDLGDVQVLSASPELFVERRGVLVRSRPMKGTAARGLHPAADRSARDALTSSEKERAENVMIVDVVRNDLGRVARLGSVRVAALCAPERYPSVWQLTSCIEAEVDPELPLSSLLRAVFPPASVTGAPKIRASQIISQLEHLPRGVYCGAIGIIRPGGDATFNVAIRTAWTHDGSVRLDAGGGVTIDSTARGELAEVRAKVAACTVSRPRPTLFETIRVERGDPLRLPRHLARLAASADYFDLPFDAARAEAVAREVARASGFSVGRLRLTLTPGAGIAAQVTAFDDDASELVGDPRAWAAVEARPVVVARTPVDRTDLWLYHKTSRRRTYDTAAAVAPRAFDVILWNREGEATELTRGNLIVELDGARWTPPVECGLLAGTLRGELLERGSIAERVLSLGDVARASRLWFVNALRGWVPIALAPDGAGAADHSPAASPPSTSSSRIADPAESIATRMSSRS